MGLYEGLYSDFREYVGGYIGNYGKANGNHSRV